ncbi:hypothetical protein ACP70R_042094 [Stipagrostis hirtigluma subsp. patula]
MTPAEEGSTATRRRRRRRTRAQRHSSPTSSPPASSPTRRGATKAQPPDTSLEGTSIVGGQAVPASPSLVSKRANKKRSGQQSERRKVAPRRSKSRKADSAATDQGSSSEASSAFSSPVRTPYIPRAVIGVDPWGGGILEPFCNISPAIADTFAKHKAKHFAKCRNQLRLVTLDENVPRSCLDDSRFEPIRESVTQMVLKVAKVVFGVSSYIDGNLLNRASGFLMDWDKESKLGTILTSALLIRSKTTSFDEWLGADEYAPHAEVHVHLLDKHDTVVNAELMHYHKHYNIALFKIKIDLVDEIPSFTEVNFGQEVFVFGRDENLHLSVDHGTVPHKGPSVFERNHYMFTNCEVNQCALGGPVVDFSGQFLGMASLPDMAFTPSSIILKCLEMLKGFDCIPRLHIGMKLLAIKFLDPVHREKIIRKCSIDTGLIVTQVSEGSMAEKVGIRIGDVIEFWNGERVSTTVELESFLLRMSEKHLNDGGDIGSNLDVPVRIFHVRKDSSRTRMLTLKVCDDVEVFAKG